MTYRNSAIKPMHNKVLGRCVFNIASTICYAFEKIMGTNNPAMFSKPDTKLDKKTKQKLMEQFIRETNHMTQNGDVLRQYCRTNRPFLVDEKQTSF